MSSVILSIKNLGIELQRNDGTTQPLLTDVSFDIHQGEMLALLGESGSGKSMTALAIMGLLPPKCRRSNGHIIYVPTGEDLTSLSAPRLNSYRGRRIAMIFQEPMTALNPVMTIGAQLNEILVLHTALSASQRHSRSLELLNEVGIPLAEQRLKSYPHELSGGLRQRIMIAMALAAEPELLIADEPTTALDVTIQAQIMKLLVSLQKKRGLAILFITHNLALASQGADCCAVMYAGEIVEMSSAKAMFSHPTHPYTQLLQRAIPQGRKNEGKLETIPGNVPRNIAVITGCRFAARCPVCSVSCRQSHPELSETTSGEFVRCHQCNEKLVSAPRTTFSEDEISSVVSSKPPILHASDLRVWYPMRHEKRTLRALDGVDLSLYPGKTLALVGESGCGKSTLGKLLIGLAPATSGIVTIDNKDAKAITLPETQHELQSRIRMIFQDPFSSLDPRMTIGESIAEGMGKLCLNLNEEERRCRVSPILEKVGLASTDYDRYPHQFSGGQRQRIGLARALIAQPDIIICDECTSALDVSVQAQILNLLQNLQEKSNIAYLFITHDLSVVEHIADSVAVMYLGRLVEEGTTAELFNNPMHPYTATLLHAAPRLKHSTPLMQDTPTAMELPDPTLQHQGCPYAPRCHNATDACKNTSPEWHAFSSTHRVRCNCCSH